MPQLNLNFNDIPIPETHLWGAVRRRPKAPIPSSRRWCDFLSKRQRTGTRSRSAELIASKIKPSRTQRAAYIFYVRQSTPGQVEHNRESTARQYALADRACQHFRMGQRTSGDH